MNNQKGFALTGAMMAWALGFATLFGGGAYLANQTFNDGNGMHGQGELQERGHGGSGDRGSDKDHSFVNDNDELKSIPMGELSETEREGLISMREEEKLARDVYRTMYELWGVRTFQNISYSENRHSLAVKTLLDRYDIADPVEDDTTGKFTIPAMQKLYNGLVAQGSTSLLNAFKVGATIEDLDIYDLNNWIASTDNEDIKMVYENLLRGSSNHMRSFDRQIVQNGGTYTAQYLMQAEIDNILSSKQEQGSHRGSGKSVQGGRRGMKLWQ